MYLPRPATLERGEDRGEGPFNPIMFSFFPYLMAAVRSASYRGGKPSATPLWVRVSFLAPSNGEDRSSGTARPACLLPRPTTPERGEDRGEGPSHSILFAFLRARLLPREALWTAAGNAVPRRFGAATRASSNMSVNQRALAVFPLRFPRFPFCVSCALSWLAPHVQLSALQISVFAYAPLISGWASPVNRK